jgi:hypothetical protein
MIDDIINQVENILRLRCAVRIARENIASETAALTTHVEKLMQLEDGLAVMVGTSPEARTAWQNAEKSAPMSLSAQRRLVNADPSLLIRQRFDRPIKKSDVVWQGRIKTLGTVTHVYADGNYLIEAKKGTYISKVRNLWMPLPGEVEDWRERQENADA